MLIMLAAEVPRTEAINNGSKIKRSIMGNSNGKFCLNWYLDVGLSFCNRQGCYICYYQDGVILK